MSDREIPAHMIDGPSGTEVQDVGTARATPETLRARLLATFEMFDFGVEMMAANLRRRHANASPEEIERLLDNWLLERPGAEAGDGPGTPVSLERFR